MVLDREKGLDQNKKPSDFLERRGGRASCVFIIIKKKLLFAHFFSVNVWSSFSFRCYFSLRNVRSFKNKFQKKIKPGSKIAMPIA